MIRVIRKNNETLQIGTLQDRPSMESTAPFAGYEATVACLRRFMHDAYNMTVLRKVLYADSYQFGIHSLSDQEVISQVARKAVRGQIFIARGKAAQYGGGSSSPSVKEVVPVEGKKWSKKEYVKSFLEESKSTPATMLGVAPFLEENKCTPVPPEPESELHWIEVCVVDDNDKPISGKPARLHATDGRVVEEVLGQDGLVRADDILEGVCKFVLPVKDRAEWIDPNAAPPAEDPKELPEGHWIVRKHIKPPGPEVPNLRTNEKHKVIIGRKIVEQLEIDEALFRLMSAVLLPEAQEPDSAPTEPDGTRPTSMDLLAASLRYAELHPDRKILITGHTDTSGGDEYNQDLSEYRARAVYAVLANEETSREDFGKVCHGPHLQGKEKKQQVLYDDRVQVLNWVATTFGWPCSTNGEFGNYLKAVKAFQSTYNTEGNEKKPKEQLAVDGDFGPACWRAVFDCYQVHLAETLECTAEELQVLQGQVRPRFLKQYVGCGKNKPKEMVGVDNYRSQTNRRVEVLFFKADDHVPETPCLVGDCDPDACELYDRTWYLRKRLPARILDEVRVFQYGIPWGQSSSWSNKTKLRLTTDTGNVLFFPFSEGEKAGSYRIVSVHELEKGRMYEGALIDGDVCVNIFGPVELYRISDPKDEENNLPIPAAESYENRQDAN